MKPPGIYVVLTWKKTIPVILIIEETKLRKQLCKEEMRTDRNITL